MVVMVVAEVMVMAAAVMMVSEAMAVGRGSRGREAGCAEGKGRDGQAKGTCHGEISLERTERLGPGGIITGRGSASVREITPSPMQPAGPGAMRGRRVFLGAVPL